MSGLKAKLVPELNKSPNLTGLKLKNNFPEIFKQSSPAVKNVVQPQQASPPSQTSSPFLTVTAGVSRHIKISTRSIASLLAILVVLVFVIYYLQWDPGETLQDIDEINKDLPFDVTTNDRIFEVGAVSFVSLKPRRELEDTAQIKIVFDDPDIIDTLESFTVYSHSSRSIFIPIHSKDIAGHCTMSFVSKSKELKNLFKLKIRIRVVHEIWFGYLSIVLGWMYFVSWAFTYYPQIYSNYKRQSVVGLSFDYIALNFTGHISYCIFNAAMYWNTYVQKQYNKLHPKGELPVHINDIMFSIHAVCGMCVLIAQCFMYERGEQKVSVPIVTLVGGLWLSIIAGLFAAIQEKIAWLKFLYYLAYIKLGTVPLKYTPQVHLNYVRKSTEGWSIHSVIFDCAGGLLSFLQMFIDAINNDDFDGTLGNPGKLGLGLMAFAYDLIFLFQHYVLYRGNTNRRASPKVWDVEQEEEDDEEIQEFSKKLEELKANIIPQKRSSSAVQEL